MRPTNSLIPLAAIALMAGCAQPSTHDLPAAQHVDPPAPIAVAPADHTAAKHILLGLLLDTSNSMDGLIDQAKSQLWNIVNKLSEARCGGEQPTIQVALYEYGNDRLAENGNYIRRVSPFTTNMDEISKQLFALSTDGGEEYCGAVIARSVDELDWGKDEADMRMLVIAGNEPFTQGPVDFHGACERARQKGIVVNTIYCGDHKEGLNTAWYAGAMAAKGDYFSIDQNAVTQQVASPCDGDLAKLEEEWNAKNVYYGDQGSYNYSNQAAQDQNAGSLGYSTANSRRMYKVKNSAQSYTWDLTEVQPEALDSVLTNADRKLMPKQYMDLSDQELKKEVTVQREEKSALKTRIAALNAQRDQYVAAQLKGTPDANALESSIVAGIERAAQAKGLSFEEEATAKKAP